MLLEIKEFISEIWRKIGFSRQKVDKNWAKKQILQMAKLGGRLVI
mgnify:CR=1 FL=1